MKYIYFIKGYCTCMNCNFECEEQIDMVKHCKKYKHHGEITLTKSIDYSQTTEETS